MTEIRLNEDGSLDEIVGDGPFQLEQMSDDQWFLSLGGVRLMLEILSVDYETYIVATPNETDTWREARAHSGQTDD